MNLNQTYLIECNRANSTILSQNEEFNSIYTSDITAFNLLVGDQVSVQSVAIESEGIGSPDVLEFTRTNPQINGERKNYVDNKVILEIGFYLNNNNGSKTNTLPLQLPAPGYGGQTANRKIPVNDASYNPIGYSTDFDNGIGANPPRINTEIDVLTSDISKCFVVYGVEDEDGQFQTSTNVLSSFKKIYLSKPGDADPSGMLLPIDTDYINYTAAFQALTGMNVLYSDIDQGQPIWNKLSTVKMFDTSNNRIVIELLETVPVVDTLPLLFAPGAGPSFAPQGTPIRFGIDNVNNNVGIGLYNADHIDLTNAPGPIYQVPRYRGNNLYNMTQDYPSSSPVAIKSFNVREGFSNKPYILLRNDYQGPQPLPSAMNVVLGNNETEFSPLLEPLTCFIELEAEQIFEDANELANRITAKLRQVNEIFGLTSQTRQLISEKQENYRIANNVIPFIQTNGYLQNGTDIENKYLYNDILKIITSPCVKTIPANLWYAPDFSKYELQLTSSDNPLTQYQNNDSLNYLKIATDRRREEYWNNQIYGNCAYKDFYKMMAGDRWLRLEVDKMDMDVSRNICRPVILNNDISLNAINTPVIDVSSSEIPYNFPIFTNIVYNESNIKRLKQVFNFNENYIPIQYSGFNNWTQQKNDPYGWLFDFDLGITNDFISNPTLVGPSGEYVNTRYVPLQTSWQTQYPNSATVFGSGTAFDTATICPPISNRVIGDDETSALPLGHIKLYTRFQQDWYERATAAKHLNEVDCSFLKNNIKPSTALSEQYNVAVYPYYNKISKQVLCFFMTADEYKFDNTDISTYTLGQISWGTCLSAADFSALSNPSLIPTNNDEHPYRFPPPPGITRERIENNTNFIWCGANNPLCSYDNQTQRFNFSNLQTNVFFAQVDAPATSFSDGVDAGVQCARINVAFDEDKDIHTHNNNVTAAANYSQKNTGIQDRQSGIFIHKVWLPPMNWKKPDNINLINYTNNESMTKTSQNHYEVVKDLIEADEDNYAGCLLDKMGYGIEQFIPHYGKQSNRYNESTKNNPIVGPTQGVRPTMTNNLVDTSVDTDMNVYYRATDISFNGSLVYSLGFLNGNSVNIQTQSAILPARRIPSLVSAPYYRIVTDLVSSEYYNSGNFTTNTAFVCLKNYLSNNFAYASSSDYYVPVFKNKTITSVNIQIFNGSTNRLAKVGKDTSVIFKVVRSITVPTLESIIASNEPASDNTSGEIEDLKQIVKRQEKIINEMIKGKNKRKTSSTSSSRETKPEEQEQQQDTEEKQPEKPAPKQQQPSGDGEEKRGE